MSEDRMFVLEHLCEELRHYRAKEFQTFIFSFPIIAAALVPTFAKVNAVIILVTAFGAVMINYLIRNHMRMSKIKNEIIALQTACDLNKHFGKLDPVKWGDKGSIFRHLGTASYVIVLAAEIIIVWGKPILQTVQNAV